MLAYVWFIVIVLDRNLIGPIIPTILDSLKKEVFVMNKYSFLTLLIGCFALIFSSITNAGFIAVDDFDADATIFDFTGFDIGEITAGDGVLSISNGVVTSNDFGNLNGKSYYDGADSSVIRLDFVTMVSAVGLDFYVNNQPTTLSIFDVNNVLIESVVVSDIGLPVEFFPYGFIGVNAGANLISYATVDTPLNGNELVIDNIIYQDINSIAEPSALAIITMGIIALVLRRFRKYD